MAEVRPSSESPDKDERRDDLVLSWLPSDDINIEVIERDLECYTPGS
jgi:hypothetical protein